MAFVAFFLLLYAVLNDLPRVVRTKDCSPPLTFLPQHSDLRNGTTLIAACMDRLPSLVESFPTWLAIEGLDEIVVVDWASSESLQAYFEKAYHAKKWQIPNLPTLVVVSVSSEQEWVLSRAFNLAIMASSRTRILKADCDSMIRKDFLKLHPILWSDNCFYRGDWRLARDENELHLNGFMYLHRHHLDQVHGYDERIQTYGWDDSDLYDRLALVGLVGLPLVKGSIHHYQHNDSDRLRHSHGKDPFVQTQVNRILVKTVGLWNRTARKSEYTFECVPCSVTRCFQAKARYVSLSLEALASPLQMEKAQKEALSVGVRSSLNFSYAFLESLTLEELGVLHQSQVQHNRSRVIVIEPEHGLSNRLRALASAMMLSRWAERLLLVHWKLDVHCAAPFYKLFEGHPSWMIVVEKLPSMPFEAVSQWGDFDMYTYMHEDGKAANKDQPIFIGKNKHLFIRSAYTLNHEAVRWRGLGGELLQLSPTPSVHEHVRRKLNALEGDFIAVHMRTLSISREQRSIGLNPAIYNNEGLQSLEKYRTLTSNVSHFVRASCEQSLKYPDLKLYIAADRRGKALSLRKQLGRCVKSKALFLSDNHCVSRKTACIQSSLAELLFMSRGKLLIGSEWSSFSEVIFLLGAASGSMTKYLLVGRDY